VRNNFSTASEAQNGKFTLTFVDEEALRGTSLRNDYEFPYLHEFMRLRATSLSIWPQEIKHMRARQTKGESFVCLLKGSLDMRLLSPVFAQNLYQGVFEDLNPTEVPEDISLFTRNDEKYPLLGSVFEHVKAVKLERGDCAYVPNFWFTQHVSLNKEAIFLTFQYESSSKLTELFIEAVHAGVLNKADTSLPEFSVDVAGALKSLSGGK